MSAAFAIAEPRRIKASHRRRRKVAAGHFVQRYYDPAIGRFLSVDPVAARETGDNFNRYWYANNNPYTFTDPDGREVRMQWHQVEVWVPTGNYHSLLTITPQNQGAYKSSDAFKNTHQSGDSKGARYATVGAGQVGGNLTAGVNRDTDAAPHQGGMVIQTPSQYANEDAFIAAIMTATANYQSNTSGGGAVDYTMFPTSGESEYNSNSFTAGLLNAVGATAPAAPPSPSPGWDNPVDKLKFEAPPKKME